MAKMSVILVRGVLKCENLKTLELPLEAIRKIIGWQNVFSLTPSYLVRQHLYILDFEVKIPNQGAFSRKNQLGEKNDVHI